MIKQRLIIAAIAMTFTLMGALHFRTSSADWWSDSQKEQASLKYYKSIEIQPGDTLWGIAEQYMTNEYNSIQEYIDELKEMNHLSSDQIHDSRYLMIAY